MGVKSPRKRGEQEVEQLRERYGVLEAAARRVIADDFGEAKQVAVAFTDIADLAVALRNLREGRDENHYREKAAE